MKIYIELSGPGLEEDKPEKPIFPYIDSLKNLCMRASNMAKDSRIIMDISLSLINEEPKRDADPRN